MINFSLNTCWRLIPTQGDNRNLSVVAFFFQTGNNSYFDFRCSAKMRAALSTFAAQGRVL